MFYYVEPPANRVEYSLYPSFYNGTQDEFEGINSPPFFLKAFEDRTTLASVMLSDMVESLLAETPKVEMDLSHNEPQIVATIPTKAGKKIYLYYYIFEGNAPVEPYITFWSSLLVTDHKRYYDVATAIWKAVEAIKGKA